MYEFQYVPLPFILHSQVEPICEQVMSRFAKGHIIPLVGVSGSGKTTLLRYLTQQKLPNQHDSGRRLALIKLAHGQQDLVRRGRALSPMTTISLSLLWHDVARTLMPVYVRDDIRPDLPSIFTEHEALSSLPKLASRLDHAQIGIVLIDTGQLLDSPALDWLLSLRDLCKVRFSIVIAITCRADEAAVDVTKPLMAMVDYPLQPLSLNTLSEGEFIKGYKGQKAILSQLLLGINAKFAPEVLPALIQIGQKIWGWTLGNWKAISSVMGMFDEELGPDDGQPRLITYAVLERVEERLTKLKEMWGDLLEPIPSLTKAMAESGPK